MNNYRFLATKNGYYILANGRTQFYTDLASAERVLAILEMRGLTQI